MTKEENQLHWDMIRLKTVDAHCEALKKFAQINDIPTLKVLIKQLTWDIDFMHGAPRGTLLQDIVFDEIQPGAETEAIKTEGGTYSQEGIL